MSDELSNFLNPKPNSLKALQNKVSNHGKHSGAFLDKDDDIYTHTNQFFEKDDAVDEVHIGEKRIRGGIEDIHLDPKVYGSRKVSRKQREEEILKMQQEESSDDSNSLENAM